MSYKLVADSPSHALTHTLYVQYDKRPVELYIVESSLVRAIGVQECFDLLVKELVFKEKQKACNLYLKGSK